MGVAKDILLDESKRPAVVEDGVKLVDSEVAAKKGVSGMLIKGGYKGFKKLKPGIMNEAVNGLLDKFVDIIDRHYSAYLEEVPDKSTPFSSWAQKRDSRIADDMLSITDDYMNRSNIKVLTKIYYGMRKIGEKSVKQAVPGISKLVMKYAD